MPVRYSHTQKGSALLFIAAAVILLGIVLVFTAGKWTTKPLPPGFAFIVGIPLAITSISLWMFSRLTVVVDESSLRWFFGRGIPRFSIPFGDIRDAQIVKPSMFFGLGIHWTGPSGWLYNVGIGPALEVTRIDGSRLRIGTDDPDALHAALAAARGVRA